MYKATDEKRDPKGVLSGTLYCSKSMAIWSFMEAAKIEH